jgi:hypothetical protein
MKNTSLDIDYDSKELRSYNFQQIRPFLEKNACMRYSFCDACNVENISFSVKFLKRT